MDEAATTATALLKCQQASGSALQFAETRVYIDTCRLLLPTTRLFVEHELIPKLKAYGLRLQVQVAVGEELNRHRERSDDLGRRAKEAIQLMRELKAQGLRANAPLDRQIDAARGPQDLFGLQRQERGIQRSRAAQTASSRCASTNDTSRLACFKRSAPSRYRETTEHRRSAHKTSPKTS